MKRQHKVPSIALESKPEPISERYAAEIERSLKRAEKAWRNAERQAQKAHERLQHEPTKTRRQQYDEVRAEAERLRREFEKLERVMKQAPVPSSHNGTGQPRHRTGNDDHLELGVPQRRKNRRGPGSTWRT